MSENKQAVALITGASRGIGRAVALALSADGYSLSLCARSRSELEGVRESILSESPRAQVKLYELDVRDQEAVSHMVNDTVKSFGGIDLLFNNAGVFRQGTSEVEMSDFSLMLDINLRAAFHFISLVAPVMKKQGSGRIINLSSRSGKIARPATGAYAASKFGLVGLNEALYRELSPSGIRVTAICPGFVDTDMASIAGLSKEEMLSTKDIVDTVRWLLTLSPAACVKEVIMEPVNQIGT